MGFFFFFFNDEDEDNLETVNFLCESELKCLAFAVCWALLCSVPITVTAVL